MADQPTATMYPEQELLWATVPTSRLPLRDSVGQSSVATSSSRSGGADGRTDGSLLPINMLGMSASSPRCGQ
jgi:hypothetical protein